MFYEGLFDPPEETLSRDMQRLKKLIPGYYGVCDIRDRAGETSILFKCMKKGEGEMIEAGGGGGGGGSKESTEGKTEKKSTCINTHSKKIVAFL